MKLLAGFIKKGRSRKYTVCEVCTMRSPKKTHEIPFSDLTVEELMLIKTSMEEKSEMLDSKDKQIHMLLKEKKILADKYRKTEQSFHELRQEVSSKEKKAFREGGEAVIEDIVHVLCKYEKAWNNERHTVRPSESMVAEGILGMLRDIYGLETIDAGHGAVLDPGKHQVVDVQQAPDGDSQIVALSKGYRIGTRVIKTACLRVIKGGKAETEGKLEREIKESCGDSYQKAKLEIIDCGTCKNPDGVA
jgi:molecular chaperone GrpE (heat shock protein)